MSDYRITKRGGKGVKTLNITEKTGKLVAIKQVGDDDDLMIINRSGITIRISVSQLRVMGRATQGVRLIKLNEDDRISSIEKIQKIEKIEEEEYLNGDVNDQTGETRNIVENNFNEDDVQDDDSDDVEGGDENGTADNE